MNENYLQIVSVALRNFYERRIERVSRLNIFDILKRKNPYLYRAFGTNDAHDFIEQVMNDYQTSSDEGIFGDFFEEVAIGVAKNGRKSTADSIDLEIWSEDQTEVKLYAVKSGPNVFNAQSKRRQNQAFNEAKKRLRGILITEVVGYSYGRKKTKANKNNFIEEAGEVFWTSITGDANFYKELINLIGKSADEHKKAYELEWDKCINRQMVNFINIFGNEDGSINWEKIVEFSSGKETPRGIYKEIKELKLD